MFVWTCENPKEMVEHRKTQFFDAVAGAGSGMLSFFLFFIPYMNGLTLFYFIVLICYSHRVFYLYEMNFSRKQRQVKRTLLYDLLSCWLLWPRTSNITPVFYWGSKMNANLLPMTLFLCPWVHEMLQIRGICGIWMVMDSKYLWLCLSFHLNYCGVWGVVSNSD